MSVKHQSSVERGLIRSRLKVLIEGIDQHSAVDALSLYDLIRVKQNKSQFLYRINLHGEM